ncbi:MAG TPA: nitronate monooxygenase [Kofleriaceae bacterium]|nr:nitronate monooxygenase [Kofleriaceae bacterium]
MEIPRIVVAPMANITTAAFVSEVCEAGALGFLGSAPMPIAVIEAQVAAIRARTQRPFGMNFFVHEAPDASAPSIAAMRGRLAPMRAAKGVADEVPAVAPPFGDAHLAVVLAARPAVVSFHFGLPDEAAMRTIKRAGIAAWSSATTVAEARELEARGVDAVIAQGAEAGGHRGMFLASLDEQTSTMALVPRVVDAVKVPVIAAGGIMDGRGIAAGLALGAAAAQLGTVFLGCPEAEVAPAYREALFSPQAARTRVTTLLSGRPARAIVTPFLDELADLEGHAAPFPIQRGLAAPFSPSLWSGQGAPLTRALPARELVAALAREAGLGPPGP